MIKISLIISRLENLIKGMDFGFQNLLIIPGLYFKSSLLYVLPTRIGWLTAIVIQVGRESDVNINSMRVEETQLKAKLRANSPTNPKPKRNARINVSAIFYTARFPKHFLSFEFGLNLSFTRIIHASCYPTSFQKYQN